MPGVVITDDRYKVVRVHNYLLSYGINNSGLHDENDAMVNREPTTLEYKMLKDATDIFMKDYITSMLQNDNSPNCSKNNDCQFIKFDSKIQEKTYKVQNIPNDNYQICVTYDYCDMYYTKDSVLTDEMSVSAECILSRALPCTKYIEHIRKIDGGETPFQGAESVFFRYMGPPKQEVE